MELLIARILDRTYLEGEMLPVVRQLAADCEVNPLTAAKAYKELSRDGLIRTTSARSRPDALPLAPSKRLLPELRQLMCGATD
jgi:DNA-binding transcriptional MocR family regulator